MTTEKPYRLSVGTADEYDDYIAEIYFPGKFGVIVSQEKTPGDFELSVHSFSKDSSEAFDYCRNVDDCKISYTDFMQAIEDAVGRLSGLKRDSD